MSNVTGLIIPGWADSDAGHWQILWLKEFPDRFKKVEQDNWMEPKLEEWIAGIDRAVATIEGDIVLIAHSLGVPLVAHWVSANNTSKITGAFLVAPCDPDHPECIPGFGGFDLRLFPFKSIVVASSNDYWCSMERANYFAQTWGSELLDNGPCGHINTEDGFGPWKEGLEILQALKEI